jgi:hypothetical protein
VVRRRALSKRQSAGRSAGALTVGIRSGFMNDQPTHETSNLSVPAWMDPACFSAAPTEPAYGYWVGGRPQSCQSHDELAERIRIDASKKVYLVWTAEVKYLVPPEEIPALFEAVFERAQVHVKKRRDSALHTSILLSGLLLFIWFTLHGVALILLLALVALGVIPLAESMAEQHRVHTYSAQQMACEVPEARFRAWLSTFLSHHCSP